MGNSTIATSSLISTLPAPKIIGVGFNYLKQGTKPPSNPVIFLKSWSSIVYAPRSLSLPLIQSSRLIHEVELGVMMKSRAFRVKKQEAMSHIAGYFLLLDITDTQWSKPGDYYPQTLIKSQDGFCPVSPPILQQVDPYSIQLQLKINGQIRQKDLTSKMHFKIDEIIQFTSRHISLNEGDLILTGTPLGAGLMKLDDRVEAFARYKDEVVASLDFKITK